MQLNENSKHDFRVNIDHGSNCKLSSRQRMAGCYAGKISPVKYYPDRDYFAAQIVISTMVPGVSTAPTAVRVGKFDRSTQAIQASFISSLRVASAM